MKKSLYSSEWVLVGSLLAILCSLLIISKVNVHRAGAALAAYQAEMVEVKISGAVTKPGTYSVEAGTLVEEVLKKARPKPGAHLKALPLKEPIEAPLQLIVEEGTEIVVTVQGAVAEQKEIKLPAKSRISDLKSKVSLTSEADKAFFRRRRMLKDGEIIEVPKKTVE